MDWISLCRGHKHVHLAERNWFRQERFKLERRLILLYVLYPEAKSIAWMHSKLSYYC